MNAVAFDWGDCIPVEVGQTMQGVITAHSTMCRECADPISNEARKVTP